jgi:hypothetical protein
MNESGETNLTLDEIRDTFFDATVEDLAVAESPEDVRAASLRARLRLDALMADVSGAKPACSAGCAYCCSFRVEVRPDELFSLAAWIRIHFSPEETRSVIAKSQEYRRRVAELDPLAHARTNLPCPLLGENGCCRAYEARPESCREHHSLRVEACIDVYRNPEDLERQVPRNADQIGASQAAREGICAAFNEANLDTGPVALGAALAKALTDPNAERSWLRRESPLSLES